MKLSAAEDLRAAIILSLGIIAFHLSGAVALTIPTTAPIELVHVYDVLPTLFPSLNATSLNASHYDPKCAPLDDDEAWYSVPKKMKWRHDTTCYEAMKLFYKEQQRHDAQAFEFLAPEAQPKTKLTTMQTPRRYSYGTSSTIAALGGRRELADVDIDNIRRLRSEPESVMHGRSCYAQLCISGPVAGAAAGSVSTY